MALVGSYEYRLDLASTKLDRLWVVDYRLSERFLSEAGNVRPYINLEKCTVVSGIVLPEGLAVVQGQCGLKYKGLSPQDACSQMSELEERGVVGEGLTAFLYWEEELLREAFIDFPGSRSGRGSVPSLYLNYDGPVLSDGSGAAANPGWGSLSRGKFS